MAIHRDVKRIIRDCQKRRNGIPKTMGVNRLANHVTGGMNPNTANTRKTRPRLSPLVKPNISTPIKYI
jgi:hypothetical protein